jgi:hypothetical protein
MDIVGVKLTVSQTIDDWEQMLGRGISEVKDFLRGIATYKPGSSHERKVLGIIAFILALSGHSGSQSALSFYYNELANFKAAGCHGVFRSGRDLDALVFTDSRKVAKLSLSENDLSVLLGMIQVVSERLKDLLGPTAPKVIWKDLSFVSLHKSIPECIDIVLTGYRKEIMKKNGEFDFNPEWWDRAEKIVHHLAPPSDLEDIRRKFGKWDLIQSRFGLETLDDAHRFASEVANDLFRHGVLEPYSRRGWFEYKTVNAVGGRHTGGRLSRWLGSRWLGSSGGHIMALIVTVLHCLSSEGIVDKETSVLSSRRPVFRISEAWNTIVVSRDCDREGCDSCRRNGYSLVVANGIEGTYNWLKANLTLQLIQSRQGERWVVAFVQGDKNSFFVPFASRKTQSKKKGARDDKGGAHENVKGPFFQSNPAWTERDFLMRLAEFILLNAKDYKPYFLERGTQDFKLRDLTNCRSSRLLGDRAVKVAAEAKRRERDAVVDRGRDDCSSQSEDELDGQHGSSIMDGENCQGESLVQQVGGRSNILDVTPNKDESHHGIEGNTKDDGSSDDLSSSDDDKSGSEAESDYELNDDAGFAGDEELRRPLEVSSIDGFNASSRGEFDSKLSDDDTRLAVEEELRKPLAENSKLESCPPSSTAMEELPFSSSLSFDYREGRDEYPTSSPVPQATEKQLPSSSLVMGRERVAI